MRAEGAGQLGAPFECVVRMDAAQEALPPSRNALKGTTSMMTIAERTGELDVGARLIGMARTAAAIHQAQLAQQWATDAAGWSGEASDDEDDDARMLTAFLNKEAAT